MINEISNVVGVPVTTNVSTSAEGIITNICSDVHDPQWMSPANLLKYVCDLTWIYPDVPCHLSNISEDQLQPPPLCKRCS